nr:MAG TPA: endoplasmic reticulum chaperone [Caudoviricetes sp.]
MLKILEECHAPCVSCVEGLGSIMAHPFYF